MNIKEVLLTGMLAAGGAMVALAPSTAAAQMRGGGLPATPVGTALDKVPVGTWAEYNIKRGDNPPRKLRQALVGKEGGAFVIETRSENGRGEKVLARTVVDADPSKEGGVKKSVIQMGDSDPMEMPTGGMSRPGGPGGGAAPAAGGEGNAEGRRGGGMRGTARYLKPDPKNLVGKETIKVAGGSFATEHYKGEGPRGGTIEYWVSKDVGPFGLVKMEVDRPGGGPGGGDGDGGKVLVELVAKGKGAKPEITKPVKPFDPSVMQGRGGPGGPPGERSAR